MLERIPDERALGEMLGVDLLEVWRQTRDGIEALYDMEMCWDSGYREWVYELKYRRGGKTLVTLYAKPGCVGIQLVFGRAEREKLDAAREEFSVQTLAVYDAAATYHDGKWMTLEPKCAEDLADLPRLLALKRRPNRK